MHIQTTWNGLNGLYLYIYAITYNYKTIKEKAINLIGIKGLGVAGWRKGGNYVIIFQYKKCKKHKDIYDFQEDGRTERALDCIPGKHLIHASGGSWEATVNSREWEDKNQEILNVRFGKETRDS